MYIACYGYISDAHVHIATVIKCMSVRFVKLHTMPCIIA